MEKLRKMLVVLRKQRLALNASLFTVATAYSFIKILPLKGYKYTPQTKEV
jgi:hypothetical protein